MHEHIISTVIYFCMIIVESLYLALSRFQKMDHIISLDLDESQCIAIKILLLFQELEEEKHTRNQSAT